MTSPPTNETRSFASVGFNQMDAISMPSSFSAAKSWVFYQDPRPEYENILQATRSYQGSARDGFYVPSKMQNIGRWCSTNQVNGMLGTHRAENSDTTPLPFGKLGGFIFCGGFAY